MVLEQMRVRAVRQMKAVVHPEDVAAALGLDRSTRYAWRLADDRGGEQALAAKPHPGRRAALSPAQLDSLFHRISGHDPGDYGFVEHLWTRDLVADLVATVFGVQFTPQWMGTVLRRLGLTPQRPAYRASGQDSAAVAAWRQQVYPAIRVEAAQAGATVYVGDESGVAAHQHAGTTWAPARHTPVVATTASRARVTMVSAVEQRGRLHFQVTEGSFAAAAFVEFGRMLLADDGGPGFLIVEDSRIHHAKTVTDDVEATEGRLRLFFLPAYAPELNPDEWVWKHVKHDEIGKTTPRGPRQHFQRAHDALAWLAAAPEVVRSFFHDPHLGYLTAEPLPV